MPPSDDALVGLMTFAGVMVGVLIAIANYVLDRRQIAAPGESGALIVTGGLAMLGVGWAFLILHLRRYRHWPPLILGIFLIAGTLVAWEIGAPLWGLHDNFLHQNNDVEFIVWPFVIAPFIAWLASLGDHTPRHHPGRYEVLDHGIAALAFLGALLLSSVLLYPIWLA